MENRKSIFLSYSWKNKDLAEVMVKDFQYFNIELVIDKTHGFFRTSIRKYMQLIGKTDYALILISDSFLRSENCMYEILELLNTHEFEDRVLPVILNDANIFKADDRQIYYDFWQNAIDEAQKQLVKFSSIDFVEKKRQAQKILADLPDFLHKVSSIFTITFEELRNQGYKPILEVIGVDDSDLASRCFNIVFSDKRSKIDIEILKSKYPDTYRTYEVLGIVAIDEGDFKSARMNFEKAVGMNPEGDSTNNNYAYVLDRFFDELELANKHYLKALEINPSLPRTNKDYGFFLLHKVHDYEGAKIHLEYAAKLEPTDDVHMALVVMYRQYFKDAVQSKLHYDALLKNNPQIPTIYCDYATLLYNGFEDLELANKFYNIAIEMAKDTPDYRILYEYATFLEDALNDYEAAEKYYEKVFELGANDDVMHLNYAIFLNNHHLDDQPIGRIISHLKQSIDINPHNALSLYYMSRFIFILHERKSIEYYIKAIKIDPTLRDLEFEARFS